MENTAKKQSGEGRVRRRLRRKKEEEKKPERSPVSEGLTVILGMIGIFILLALSSHYYIASLPEEALGGVSPVKANLMGVVGGRLARMLTKSLGWCSFVTALWAFLLGRSVWFGSRPREGSFVLSLLLTMVGSLVMAASCALGAAVFAGEEGGGWFGLRLAAKLEPFVNPAGTLLVSIAVFMLSLGVATGVSLSDIVRLGRALGKLFGKTMIGGWIVSTKLGRAFFRTNLTAGKVALRATSSTAHSVAAAVRARREARERRRALGTVDERRLLPLVLEADLTKPGRRTQDRSTEKRPEQPAQKTEEKRPRILRSYEDELKPKERFKLGRKILKSRLKERRAKTKKKAEPPVFQLPSPDLLVKAEASAAFTPKDDEILRNSRQLQRTLADFNIGGNIVEVQPGPVITLYQFEPAPGIKVQRIVNLADDLALALKSASVRVYGPVPGKGTVGIEVPNAHREIVRLRDILDCPKFSAAESALSLAFGKDTFGEPFVADLAKMPHLLIAGATGTGKSVCINSLLLSLLYRNAPADLRLILIDPKMLELSVYDLIPHLKAPVVTDPKHARGVFWWAVEEMERRYRMMAEFGVRSLESYNKLATSAVDPEKIIRRAGNKVIELEEKDVVATATAHEGVAREVGDYEDVRGGKMRRSLETLPRIVIVVDELADLMLTVGRESEELLTRLAQKARAAGIHLILATQRPSVNVITGLIKANFPSRISFKVASRIDSRTVLDVSGAEKLLGQGDMLFMTSGAGRPKRIHAAFVSDKEVHDVVNWLRAQGEPDYDPRIEEMIERLEEQASGQNAATESEEFDPLYDQAVNLVIEKGQASTSLVQRVFRIGYNRAARILETMEREGVVGPADGAKPRSILVAHRDRV